MSHIDNIEEVLAYDMIVLATDRLSQHLTEEDWEAAIVGALIRAVEVASYRKVKPIDEIYQPKPIWLGIQETITVYQSREIQYE